ncbi:Tol-pal system protein [Novimethylophilus kurashikiensis]|uniref:Tol-pal system protein n=1 Tax=Novimethylophilus kurashikiensis TaxID=1825523 RepID=A0A2R5F952_9PROT|nr:Tol-pal system protein [Novimethylophilus kurashikiensis]
MTDVVQARESAVAAETKAEQFFHQVLDKLNQQNSRLIELHDTIKSLQPVASGSICLELYPCGPGCTGCPHPRWVKYFWTQQEGSKPPRLVCTNLDAQSRDPVRALSRGEEHYKELAGVIRETKVLMENRAALLSAIRSLRNAAKRK